MKFNILGWQATIWDIITAILFFILFIVGINSCDYRSDKLISDQATTFEQELSFRQRKEIELENKIKKQQEIINKLERQLECKGGENDKVGK